MSNLYRAQTGNQYTRIIDNNEILEQKLSALALEQKQKAEKAAREAARLRKADLDGQDTPEFQEGIFPEQFDVSPELQVDFVERAKDEASRIIAEATRDAEEILRKASEEAENLKENTKEAAYAQGYADGRDQAEAEAGQMRQELNQQRANLLNTYQEKLDQMEAELMQVMTEVYNRVFQIEFGDKADILLYLIQQTVQEIKNSHEYRVRVSTMDFDYIFEKKQEIIQKVGGDVTLDILSDESLSKGQCTIDTEEGIFDCSIDVELENLTKDLRALSVTI